MPALSASVRSASEADAVDLHDESEDVAFGAPKQ
jgi:hypothetical protein